MSRLNTPGIANTADVHDPYSAGRLIVLRQITALREEGCNNQAILMRVMERGLPTLDYILALRALTELGIGPPQQTGRVCYSKQMMPGEYLRVDYNCFANGEEWFSHRERWDSRSYDHVPTLEERRAAQLLVRLSWSSYRIVIDDVIDLLRRTDQAASRRGSLVGAVTLSAAPSSDTHAA